MYQDSASLARNLRALLCTGLMVLNSCAAEPVALTSAEVVVPGDWVPPDRTLAISDPQYVEVVEPPPVAPLGSCESSCPDDIWGGLCTHPACLRAHPGTTELDTYIRSRWTYARAGGTFSCRRNSNPSSCNNLSVHSIGRAIDLMITEIGGDADNTAGDAIANWLIENAEYIGIQRVIWDGMYWNGSRRGAHFSPISDRLCGGRYCTDHHTNHIHVELSVDGAARRTRFFTDGAPPETCPVVCYGTAAVRADCSYTDCALTGEVCLTDPVRCGPGAPPEPAEAARNAGVTLPAVSLVAGLARFVPIASTRLFDTRTPAASTALSRSDGASSGPLGGARSGTIAAFPGVPADATSVWLNVTAVPLTMAGFVTVAPAGVTASTSTLNYSPPRVRANATVAALGAGGGVTFSGPNDVDVIADLGGALAATGLGLRTAGPRRVLDTRSSGMRLEPRVPFAVDVGAPAEAQAVVASVAAIQSGTEPGFVTAFACGSPVPESSNINFVASSVAANTVISALGSSGSGAGQLCFVSSVAVDLVVDVTGYLVPDGELSYQALSPVRVLDTRSASSLYSGRLGDGQTIELPLGTAAGMPADVRAAVVNVTTLSPGTRGFVTVFPCGPSVPGTSSLNFDSDEAIAALSVSATTAGSLCVFSNSRTHLIVDLLGVWVPTPGAPPPRDEMPPPEEPDERDPPGADGGVSDDGGAERDAGLGTGDGGRRDGGPSAGCSCHAAGPASSRLAWLGLILAATVSCRVRRR